MIPNTVLRYVISADSTLLLELSYFCRRHQQNFPEFVNIIKKKDN